MCPLTVFPGSPPSRGSAHIDFRGSLRASPNYQNSANCLLSVAILVGVHGLVLAARSTINTALAPFSRSPPRVTLRPAYARSPIEAFALRSTALKPFILSTNHSTYPMIQLFTFVWNGIYNAYQFYRAVRGRRPWVLKRRAFDGLELIYGPGQTPDGPFLPMVPVQPATPPCHTETILPRGHRRTPNARALMIDTIFEKDLPLVMRDGVRLYADVFRPADPSKEYPAIVAWGPYGKHQNNDTLLSRQPEYVGLSQSDFSGYENFEGPDPAYWNAHGYAVVNVDCRGAWNSEGDLHYWGKQDELDGYDAIEYLATLPWASGKVGMSGNSWLAIAQWFIAAGCPPHLSCIAPWEGISDVYRDNHRRGGISGAVMCNGLAIMVPTKGLLEDGYRMADENPVWNAYWEDKKAALGKIKIPTYVLASHTSKLHISGSLRGFRNISSKHKWLRVHPHQEWYDFFTQQDDLRRFFDRYLMGVANDWEATPRVRFSYLRFTNQPVANQPYDTFPPSKSMHQKYYLDNSTETAKTTELGAVYSREYRTGPKNPQQLHFDIIFRKPTTLIGYPNLRLHLQCNEHDDMDVFVLLRKLDRQGHAIDMANFPTSTPVDHLPKLNVCRYQGPCGMIRASHSAVVDSTETYPGELHHEHTREDFIQPGTIHSVNFSTWPIGIMYDAGEGLRLVLSGNDLSYPEAPHMAPIVAGNRGSHILYTGGRYDSYLSLPVLQD